jgi:two-component system, NarL family, nitrate/nitrite response regulator NarL
MSSKNGNNESSITALDILVKEIDILAKEMDMPHVAKSARIADPPSVNHTTKPTIRILVADGYPTILETVKGILNAHPGFEVVGEARDGQQAVSLAESLKPNVIVINVTMPKMSGFEAARHIRTRFPDCAIVILSSNKDRQFIAEAQRVGANGYVEKSIADEQFIRAIESAVKGEEYFLC